MPKGQLQILYRVSKNDLYRVWEKYQKYDINIVCNDNTCIVLVMISTLCVDDIIMMSRFVKLCHDIIENQWNYCFDFLCREKDAFAKILIFFQNHKTWHNFTKKCPILEI